LGSESKRHPLLDLQLREATGEDGKLDLDALLGAIDNGYHQAIGADEIDSVSGTALLREVERLVGVQQSSLKRVQRELGDLRSAVSAIGNGIASFDTNDKLIFANDAFFCIFGLDANVSILGEPFDKILAGTIETELFDDTKFLVDTALEAKALPDGEAMDLSFELCSGTTVSGDITKQPNGNWVATFSSTNEKGKASAGDLDAENRWMFALESAQQGVWDANLVTGETFYSHTWTKMRGLPDSETTTNMLSELAERIHPEDLEVVEEFVENQKEKSALEHSVEYREKHADGSWRWILGRGRAIAWDAVGNPTRVIGTDTDITDLKEAQTAVVETEERWNFALAGAGQGVWDLNLVSNAVYLSPIYQEMHGIGPDDIIDDHLAAWQARIHEEDKSLVSEAIAKLLSGKSKSVLFDYREQHADSDWVRIESRVMSVAEDAEGKPTRIIGVDTDVTIKKQLESQLVKSHEVLNTTLDNFPYGIAVFDENLIMVVSNKSYYELSDLDEAWFPVGSTFEDIIRSYADKGIYGEENVEAQVQQFIEDARQPIKRSQIRTNEDGTESLEFRRTPMEKGGFVFVVEDITEKLSAEREKEDLERDLAQAQKLEALGTLASGVAHEINTPVQYVGDNIQFMKDGVADLSRFVKLSLETIKALPATDATQRVIALEAEIDLEFLLEEMPLSVNQSIQGIEQVASIVNAIKEFSHPGKEEKVGVDLNAAINTTIAVSKNQWKYVAEVDTNLQPDLPTLTCHANDINQVILNLVVNAAHAIESAELGEQGLISISSRLEGTNIVIEIADNGCGMTPETLEKMYDPFFTTKDIGKGTGQGLSITFGIIKRKHNGAIDCESELGKGTTFTITLPLLDVPLSDGVAA